jgi:hypothetical protein
VSIVPFLLSVPIKSFNFDSTAFVLPFNEVILSLIGLILLDTSLSFVDILPIFVDMSVETLSITSFV